MSPHEVTTAAADPDAITRMSALRRGATGIKVRGRAGGRRSDVLQLVASVLLIGIGLYVSLFADTSSDMRLFGWVVAVIGVLGVVVAVVLPRRRHDG
jgi:hypothetical protein